MKYDICTYARKLDNRDHFSKTAHVCLHVSKYTLASTYVYNYVCILQFFNRYIYTAYKIHLTYVCIPGIWNFASGSVSL